MHPDQQRCDFCGHPTKIVWVHGHGQCNVCGINVEPCCQGGETCPAESTTPRDATPQERASATSRVIE